MQFHAQIINRKLVPEYDSDNEILSKLKPGTTYKFEVTQPRNYNFHKKLFGLINLCFQNQSQYNNFEHLRGVLIMKAGYYETVVTDKGTVYWPKSISYAKMDNLEFEQLYSKVLDEVCKMIGSTSEEIEIELINFF